MVHCLLANISVTGLLVDSPTQLPSDDKFVTLQFGVAVFQEDQEAQMVSKATIRNMNVSIASGAQPEMFAHGMLLEDLGTRFNMLMQNLTYERC